MTSNNVLVRFGILGVLDRTFIDTNLIYGEEVLLGLASFSNTRRLI